MKANILNGWLVDLTQITAISPLLTDWRPDRIDGVRYYRTLYLEVHMQGTVIRHQSLRQHVLPSAITEPEATKWSVACDQMRGLREQLIMLWKEATLDEPG